MPRAEAKETAVPFSLLGVGIALLFVAALRSGGSSSLGATLFGMSVLILVNILITFGIVAVGLASRV